MSGRGFDSPLRFRCQHRYHGNVRLMFGPLNGVRVALVAAATVAAIVAFIAGFAEAGAFLLLGILLHGGGWLYLYGQRTRRDEPA